jgi:hypothetical protein
LIFGIDVNVPGVGVVDGAVSDKEVIGDYSRAIGDEGAVPRERV